MTLLRIGIVLALACASACTQSSKPATKASEVFRDPIASETAEAACEGDIKQLRSLIGRGVDVDFESDEAELQWGKDTVTLLVWAVHCERADSVRTLLEAGASPNKTTRRGMSPLILASLLRSPEIFDFLLTRSDPNMVFGRPNGTALSLVVRAHDLGEERFARAEKLITRGADVNLDLDRGATAVTALGRLGEWRAVYWLLQNGAKHEVRDQFGGTVSCSIRHSYQVNTLAPSEAYIYRDKVRDLLLQRGVPRSELDPSLNSDLGCGPAKRSS